MGKVLGQMMGIGRLNLDASLQARVDGLVKDGQRLLPTFREGQPNADVDVYLTRCKEIMKEVESGIAQP